MTRRYYPVVLPVLQDHAAVRRKTDPNKLYDLIAEMENRQVYSSDHGKRWSTAILTALIATSSIPSWTPVQRCTSS